MNRRQMALQIGGRFLLKAILRRFPDAVNRFRRRLTTEEVNRYQLADHEADAFLAEELPSFMTKEASDLTEAERFMVREAFYEAVNMTAVTLTRWFRDPRVLDGIPQTFPLRQPARSAARRHIRELTLLQAGGRRSGIGWQLHHYDIARKSIFVVQNLYRVNFVDYDTWVILRNFGRDWGRPAGQRRFFRRLPPLVALEAQLALIRYRKPGTQRPSL